MLAALLCLVAGFTLGVFFMCMFISGSRER